MGSPPASGAVVRVGDYEGLPLKPVRWELGSYMYANSKALPGVFFMVWGVALAILWVREAIAHALRLLTPRKPYLLLPPPDYEVAPFPIPEQEGPAGFDAEPPTPQDGQAGSAPHPGSS